MHDELAKEFAESGLAGEIVPFIGDMPAAFAQADLVICRSGAGAVSELAAAGKPAVLVPFPFAADDHQTKNAEAMERAGAAILSSDAKWTGMAIVRQRERAVRGSRTAASHGRMPRARWRIPARRAARRKY